MSRLLQFRWKLKHNSYAAEIEPLPLRSKNCNCGGKLNLIFLIVEEEKIYHKNRIEMMVLVEWEPLSNTDIFAFILLTAFKITIGWWKIDKKNHIHIQPNFYIMSIIVHLKSLNNTCSLSRELTFMQNLLPNTCRFLKIVVVLLTLHKITEVTRTFGTSCNILHSIL